jgi:hypothetical protein
LDSGNQDDQSTRDAEDEGGGHERRGIADPGGERPTMANPAGMTTREISQS